MRAARRRSRIMFRCAKKSAETRSRSAGRAAPALARRYRFRRSQGCHRAESAPAAAPEGRPPVDLGAPDRYDASQRVGAVFHLSAIPSPLRGATASRTNCCSTPSSGRKPVRLSAAVAAALAAPAADQRSLHCRQPAAGWPIGCAPLAKRPPASLRPDDRAQIHFGYALLCQTIGEQSGQSDQLAEAVAAYRAALTEYTRERVPLDWAMTQNNLGNALADAWRARERDGAAGGGGRRLSRGAEGMDARARAARLGDDAEQSRHRAPERSASARAARRGWRRRSPPIARR